MRRGPVFASVVIHVCAVMLLLLLASIPAVRDRVARLPDRVVPLFAPRLKALSNGGGQRNPLPASRGKTPPRAVTKIFVPPMAVRIENPKLAVQQAMVDAPDININATDIGDPMGAVGLLSGGPGGPSGIGGGPGPGIGNGPGPGAISYKALGITQEPKLLHAEEPEYSDDARRARLQGTVVLAIDVDVNGRVTNVRVIRSLGMGLDERAIAAVQKWKFRPAMAGGRPVTAPAQALVTFHLL
jgi:periplasmic protein TonB